MATSYSNLDFSMNRLVTMIGSGELGLPELQRPFVWNRVKVRDLFDSMYRGFPVGNFLFWKNSSPKAKLIGMGHQQAPENMIVDGQQRLTSLYAVLTGKSVVTENFKKQNIEIAFRPTTCEFAVADATIRNSAEWIPNITKLFQASGDYAFITEFLERLTVARSAEIAPEEKQALAAAISKVKSLEDYQFKAVVLSADTDPEEAAEIFVRVNSKGVELTQADFILTLLSVYWDEGRRALEKFAREGKVPSQEGPSPFNPYIEPMPERLLRVAIATGFRRGRMRDGYAILRGRDTETHEYSEKARAKNFETLKKAQAEVLDLTNWHEFLKCLARAGFRSNQMITSELAVFYTYALYLIGHCDFGISHIDLRDIIARWFFMATVTNRYTGSTESRVNAEMARLADISSQDQFYTVLNKQISETLTSDFWSIQLPANLETSSARSPYLFAYYAALNLLGARVLFSDLKVSDLFTPHVHGNKSALEKHHLFPRSYLERLGISEHRKVNQIANFALIEWPDNIDISDQPPADYAPKYFRNMSEKERRQALFVHALPENWWAMEYDSFLAERRRLMAQIVKAGFEAIGASRTELEEDRPGLAQLIAEGETREVEFKATARWNLRENRKDNRMEFAVARTIAGFLNTGGGTLIVGIADDGKPLGLDHDYCTLKKQDADGFQLWLTDLILRSMGPSAAHLVSTRIEAYDGHEIARITVQPSPNLVYLNPPKGDRPDDVYIRLGNSTRKLTPKQIEEYLKTREFQSNEGDLVLSLEDDLVQS